MATPFTPIVSENFNGGEVFAVEPILLKPNELQKAINVRFKLGGGFISRPGFAEMSWANFTGIGTGKIQGMFATADEIYIAVNGKIFVTLGNLSNAFELYSGLDTSADVQFLDFQNDIYVMNGVNFPLRIARTTIASGLTAGVSTSIVVSTGQGWRFGNSGTVRVISSLGFDDITFTAKTNDTLTVTAGTVDFSHPAGSLIFEVKSTTAPKIGIGAEFLNVWWGAGNPGELTKTYQGNTLFYSRIATGINPEYFYDFAGSGSGFIPVGDKGDIQGLIKTKTYLLILKKTSIYYCDGFTASGIPNIQPLSDVYGTAGKRAFSLVGDQVITFTGKSIKQVGEQENLGGSAVPSVNPQFDDKIFKKLQSLDENQSTAVLHFNQSHKLMKICVKDAGGDTVIVFDTNIAEQPWSRDTGKPMACAVTFKGETYWGSNSEPKIFQEEVGYDDNGIGIRVETQTADFNANNTRLSKYFQYYFLYGLLGENTVVTVKIYFDGELIQQFTLTDALITPSGGSPIGRVRIGGGGIAISDSLGLLGYPFELEKLLKKRRDTGKMSVEFIADGEGQVFEIKGQEINGFYGSKFDRKIRS